MKQFLICAGLFLLCAVMNMVNVLRTGNGFGLVLAVAWLAASIVCYMKYRKTKQDSSEEDKA